MVLDVKTLRPGPEVVVDNDGPGFYATPYFWVGHHFRYWKNKGYHDSYRSNGGRIQDGEFVRFTPDLKAGRYEVSFVDETPFPACSRFPVVIRHRDGLESMVAEPSRSRTLGTFDFTEGGDGYVQISTAGSTGLVVADAVRFRRVR